MPTQSFQRLDLADLVDRLEDLVRRLDVVLELAEERERDRINAAYRQGVEDERKHRTGRDPKVAKYIRSFPQTSEFIQRISDLLIYLLPHYIREGKSYLTIAFGCTGGQHRSVMIAEDVAKRLKKAGYRVKVSHRDSPK